MNAEEARGLGNRAEAMINALAAASDDPGRLTRLYLTPAHRRAVDMVAGWMAGAGLAVRMDAAATVHGLLPAGVEGPRADKRLLIGSHIDTVVDAGRYDGSLGVVAGILAVEALRARGVVLPFALEVLAFGDEEGVRFPKTLISSSTIAGALDETVLDAMDAEETTVRQALTAFGCDPAALAREGYRRADTVGFLEVHIEQGPVLDRANEPLAVVSAIASQGRYRVRIRGEAGHAGTVPMADRHDALAAAAEVIATIEAVGLKGARASLVATVGAITVQPGAVNVIPGAAEMSLDVRAADDAGRDAAVAEIRHRVPRIGARRGVVIGVETLHETPVAVAAPRLTRAIAAGIRDVTGAEPRALMSGAGHDGQAMIHLTDIGMMFVRCRAGISHNPMEQVSIEDMGLAVEALVRTVVELAGEGA
jgi:allantoate deiminase